MDSIEGTVIIVQESRFQLIDRDGVGHQFVLSSGSSADAEQLTGLQGDKALVRVFYRAAPDLLANAAVRIALPRG